MVKSGPAENGLNCVTAGDSGKGQVTDKPSGKQKSQLQTIHTVSATCCINPYTGKTVGDTYERGGNPGRGCRGP